MIASDSHAALITYCHGEGKKFKQRPTAQPAAPNRKQQRVARAGSAGEGAGEGGWYFF